ncbi:MAG: YHS domain-containing protein [Fimbriimonas ginsengisoli]|uniref:YHS domain-containing protein n=1 Tax=Fimbriimonas ginsengisoli TaxID=1005039 RepID=A0A931PVN5_FIMGI|nr:YHS domain-containing protein [Fimbriimonas ginsengisoli]
MKSALALFALAAIVGVASAQMGHKVAKNAKHVIKCPVSGDKTDMDRATKNHLFTDYKGNRYFFCCSDCPPMFKKNPAKYANKPHIKTPKPQVKAHKAK